jgi:hypothetical protein
MCPTRTGRVHTRVATIVGPVLLALAASLVSQNPEWLVLIALLLVQGVLLDVAVYPWLLRYQPPWMTGVLAVGEFALLLLLATLLQLDLPLGWAIVFYWVCWAVAIATKIVILPIASLTYLESAGEFRRSEWSVPPSQHQFQVRASDVPGELAPGPVLGEATRLGSRLQPLPAPSGFHRVPSEGEGAA